MGYFQNHRSQLRGHVSELGEDTTLRTCQIGAYWAVKSHFTTQDEVPAIVSIPTGGGKTALMMLLSFGLDAERVLIVSPSNFVRNQTADKFKRYDGLTDANIIPEELEPPTVKIVNERITSQEAWSELSEADVVVALPNNISEVYDRDGLDDIVAPEPEFFDLVFFDEAHHARATSWQQLVSQFDDARRILLTATPFRRDRQSLPGNLVYHYPLAQAIEDDIYEKVGFTPFVPTEEGNKDLEFALRAEQELDRMNGELQSSASDVENVQALIRTNTIDNANKLKQKYDEQTSLRVTTVHSKNSDDDNEEAVRLLKDGTLDGVIAVGQLGEGFDVETLKLGVFHDPPKSFPFTLQLIGRVTRPLRDSPVHARIIANPEAMQEEGVADTVKKLYREDRAWRDIIPELVDEFIPPHQISSGPNRILLGVRKSDIEPYLSASLYRVSQHEFDPEQEIEIDFVRRLYRVDTDEDSYVGWISEELDQPAWATNTSLIQTKFDLHLYYLDSLSDTLFEYTSSDRTAARIRQQITEGPHKRVRGSELMSLMDRDDVSEYLTTGLRGSQRSAGSLPSYKMYLGDRVEYSVDTTDRETYYYGHAMARIDDNEGEPEFPTRGVGIEKGSVWSSGRRSIDEFVRWCRGLARQLNPNESGNRVERLGLRYPTEVSTFSQRPFIVAPDAELFRHSCTVVDRRDEENRPDDTEYATKREVTQPKFDIVSFDSETNQEITLNFYPEPSRQPIRCTYNVQSDSWSGEIVDLTFDLDKGRGGEFSRMSGRRFFRRYPPQFHLGNGELIRSGASFQLAIGSERLPLRCFETSDAIDWSTCDRRVEYRGQKIPKEGLYSVHEWLEEYLTQTGNDGQIVFRDHSSGEISDYIQFEPEDGVIRLFHCKSGKTKRNSDELNIGATLGHVTDVLDQVLRSRIWIRSGDLVERIEQRNLGDTEPAFFIGEEEFSKVKKGFDPETWNYEVVVVLPTLDYVAARETDRVNMTLLTCYEWLNQVDTDFRIIGDQGSNS